MICKQFLASNKNAVAELAMPQKQVQSQLKMKGSAACHCCPYGFHIDRDFVRYCDSLYNNAQLEKLKQHKRERRKEKKSVESYLGLTSLAPVDTNGVNPEKVEQQTKYIPSDLFLNCDSLKDAVSDFEDTWQKSLKKSSSCNAVIEKKNGFKFFESLSDNSSFGETSNSFQMGSGTEENSSSVISDFANVQSRSSSTSSISSRSTTVSSIGVQVPYIPDNSSMSQQITATMASLSHAGAKSSHNTVGIHRSVLTCIREQMATSLNRMKELEEQVKFIPILQMKLSTLKEEKKALMLQLQSKDCILKDLSLNFDKDVEKQLKRLEDEGITSPRLSRKVINKNTNGKNLSSPSIASSLDAALTKKCFIENEIICHLQMDSNISKSNIHKENTGKTVKSIGILCSVLTRDIGIGHVPNKSKSIGVGNDTVLNTEVCKHCKQKKHLEQSTSMSSESLESDIDSVEDGVNVFNHLNQNYIKNKSTNFGSSIQRPTSLPSSILVHVAVGTEIKCDHKSVNTDLKHTDVISKIELESKKRLLRNKSTLCVPPSKISKTVQTSDSRTYRHFGVQTTKSKIDVDQVSDIHPVPKGILVQESSLSNRNMSNNISAISKVRLKSTAVGDCSTKDIICDKCSSRKLVSTSSGNASVHDTYCEKCILRQTETIGVGDTDITDVICDNCQKEKKFKLKEKFEMHSIGTNTISESISNLSTSGSAIHICDKCSATIHSVAQDLAASNTESKIPRLNFASTQSAKVSKQQTKYTKTDFQPTKQHKFTFEKASAKAIDILKVNESQNIKSKAIKMTDKDHLQNALKENEKLEFDGRMSHEQNVAVCETLDLDSMPALPHKKVELNKEVKAACKVLNDYLQKPGRGSEKKILSSLNIIQSEWFKVANQKNADPLLIEGYLDSFEDFSKALLHRIVNLSDTNGNTALHYAVSYGNFDVVSILIDSKVCDVNKQNKAGYTSIMLVALAEMRNDAHHYVVQRLFSIGDINVKAMQNGQTALMLAVSHGKKDIVKMLLDVGAEINLQDKDGSTALMCAAEHGHLDIVKLLLSHAECDPYIVDGDDCNALTIAMEAGHKDIGLLIYANMNFSRGSSPYSTLKARKRSTPRSTPPPRTPTLRTPPPPSPSARSTNSIPSSFIFHN